MVLLSLADHLFIFWLFYYKEGIEDTVHLGKYLFFCEMFYLSGTTRTTGCTTAASFA
jgi:hypothetical protein